MAEGICSEEDCERPAKVRGLCGMHYGRAYRAGMLAPNPEWHRLSNVDVEAKTADCSICGSVRIRPRSGRGAECMTQRNKGRGQRGRTPESRRRYRLKSKYGITETDYQELFEAQGGVCAVCERSSTENLYVDHDHQTGHVRGLLCRGCNLSLGYLRDDSYNAVSAAKYLMRTDRSN